ncbi:MAG: glycosyltransferase family 2 protein [Deltaproteobacteria bacterium]|nr:glycosyltransferase family 2 protein [Deltaproteobacteria bacterium]
MHANSQLAAAETMPVRVAIVTVAYRSREALPNLLASLDADGEHDLARDIIVVDNDSRDGTVEWLRAERSDVVLVESGRNGGFGAGVNLGVARAAELGCTHVAVLNPDTRVRRGWLSPLLSALENTPGAMCVQPLILMDDGRRVNSAGNRVHLLGFGFTDGYGRDPTAYVDREPFACATCSGCAFVMRVADFSALGGFDETFFLYVEDQDLGWRVRLAGGENLVVPASMIDHDYTFSKSADKFRYLERNRWAFVGSYFPWSWMVRLAPFFAAMEIAVLLQLARGGLAGAKWRAMREAMSGEFRAWVAARRRTAMANPNAARVLKAHISVKLEFEGLGTSLADRILNPLLSAWWRLVGPRQIP